MNQGRILNFCLALICVTSAIACPAEEPPPLSPPEVGVIVGEVFAADGSSLGGAKVEVYGTSTKVTSRAGKQFVLQAIPKGTHRVTITDPVSSQAVRISVTITQRFQTVSLAAEDTTLGRVALTGTVQIPGDSAVGAWVYLVGGSRQQMTQVSDNGEYTLKVLPLGSVQIAYSKPGYQTIVNDMVLSLGDNSAPAVVLGSSSVANLAINGHARLEGEVDHRGIVVTLDHGEKITTTDQKGAYAFHDLHPGLYHIRAQAPGHQSAELAAVALDSHGSAHGLVDLFLARGSDPSPADRSLEVAITSPQVGQQFRVGDEITLLADARLDGAALPPGQIQWSYEVCSSTSSHVELGSGNGIVLDTRDLQPEHYCLTATVRPDDIAPSSAQSVFEVLPQQLGVQIVSPGFGDAVVAKLPFDAAVDVQAAEGVEVSPSDIDWSFRWFDANGDPSGSWRHLGNGRVAVLSLPDDALAATMDIARAEIQASVHVPEFGLTRSDSIIVDAHILRPLAEPPVTVSTTLVHYARAQAVRNADGSVDHWTYSMYLGQPVTMRVLQGPERVGRVAWTLDSSFQVDGQSIDLSLLTLGEHQLQAHVYGQNGRSAQVDIFVTVMEFNFSALIVAPELHPSPPYLSGLGVPLILRSIEHPYQGSFKSSDVRWFHSQLGQIGTGFNTRAFGLPVGPGTIWVEVKDAFGHSARASTDYVVQDVSFVANLLLPADGALVFEHQELQFFTSYTHNLVPSVYAESDLTVRYFSSIQGLLQDADGRTDFLPSETVTVDSLVPGVHQITVHISDGSLTAEDQHTLTVRAPGVSAELVKPADDAIYFSGDRLQLEARESHDSAQAPLLSWYLDGQEFDPAWGGYGDHASSRARLHMDLGGYDSNSAPFDDPRWSTGVHEIAFYARLPEVDVGLGCVNIPAKAICARIRIHLASATPAICPTDNVDYIIDTGNIEIWSGVRRLNCRVYIRNGGAVDVAPGTRVLVDSGDADQRRIVLQSGTLTVGRPGGDLVVIEGRGASAAAGAWHGITLGDSAAQYAGAATATFNNVILRHAFRAFENYGYWDDPRHHLELRDVGVEDSNNGIYHTCADVLERGHFTNITDQAISEDSFANCPTQRSYTGLTFDNVFRGIGIHGGGQVRLSDIQMDGIQDAGLWYIPNSGTVDVRVLDSRFDNDSSVSAAAIDWKSCSPLRVHNSQFTGNKTAIWTRACTAEDEDIKLQVLGSRFRNNEIAVRSDQETQRADELHLNSFVRNIWNIYLTGRGVDVQAQGNYLGPRDDLDTAGGAALAQNAGVFGDLPQIFDRFDAGGGQRYLRYDNPLQYPIDTLSPAPVAYIREPRRTRVYNAERCIPLVAESPLAAVDVYGRDASGPICHWWMDGDPDSGTEVFRDDDGCLDTAQTLPSEGPHDLLLECRAADANGGLRRDRHATQFEVEGGAYRGRQWRVNETWSGDVQVDGDIRVPVGSTLHIDPDTRIRVSASDRMRHGVVLRWPQDQAANADFGRRDKIEIFVQGHLQVQAASGSEVHFEASSGAIAAGQWGGLRVYRGGVLELDHVGISSATVAIQSEFKSSDPSVVPVVYVRHSSVDSAEVMYRGAAPAVFSANDVSDVDKVFDKTMLYAATLSIDDSHFRDLNNLSSDSYLWFGSYAAAGPSSILLRLRNSSVVHGVGFSQRSGVHTEGTAIQNVEVTGCDFANLGSVFEVGVPLSAFQIQDSSFYQFDRVFYNFHGTGELKNVTIDHSLFDSGGEIYAPANQPTSSFFMTRSHVRDLDTALSTTVHAGLLFAVTRSAFDHTGTAFQFQMSVGSIWEQYRVDFDLSGNNYQGTQRYVLDLNENLLVGCDTVTWCNSNHGLFFVADMSGSYFGVTTEPEILTLLDDPGEPIAGRQVDHSGWVSTALTLDTP